MKFSLGSDHAGFEWKNKVKQILQDLGHEVVDHGTNSSDSVDYPDFGSQVAQDVVDGVVDFGVVVCGTGNGMNMVVNRFAGVRGALVLNPEMAMFARAHNNANVLTLAGKYTPEADLESIINNWIETKFDGGRHKVRVDKMSELEQGSDKPVKA
ncbi:ribose 5-phosphate isomerase B [bacterium AH-315-J21]|nr:ribose 5-phosphate isomerase B [bacterium AH-315-J21]